MQGGARRRRPDSVSAGGVVVRRTDGGWDVCLIRVRDAWSLPKGALEPGEASRDAALREISEETGLPRDGLRVLAGLPPAEYFFRSGARLVLKRVDHFLVESDHGDLRPDPGEVDAAAWVPLAEAGARIAHRDLAPVIAEAARLLGAPLVAGRGSSARS